MEKVIIDRLKESIDVKSKILNDENTHKMLKLCCETIIKAFQYGGKIVLCGNGGSASDALHIAGEFVGRFRHERKPLPAIVLNADVASMTAIANDYGFENVFCRQVEGFMQDNDVLIGISTSGNSENVIKAILKAKSLGRKTIGLLGNDGGKIGSVVDFPIIVPSNVTARIQECHITIGHIICEIVESSFANIKSN